MTNGILVDAVIAVIAAGALAIAGAELGIRKLTVVFKPLATVLLLVIAGWPHTEFARLVWVGIILSLVGDVALLSEGDKAFAGGLIAFLAAHVVYIVANVGVAHWSPLVAAVAVIVVVATIILLRFARPQTTVLRVAIAVYGTALSTMVVSAWATLGGRLAWAPFAAAGAVLFYISDSSLALNKFHRPIPHVSYLALGVYWLGQIGIALAARGPVL
jgi:uncharacterized membrane protein YhhN